MSPASGPCDGVQRSLQILCLYRLSEEHDRWMTHGLLEHRAVGEAGDDDDRGRRQNAARLGEKLRPRHPGHDEIEENDVWSTLLDAGESFFSIQGCLCLESQALKHSPCGSTEGLLIVDDEHAELSRCASRRGILSPCVELFSVKSPTTPDLEGWYPPLAYQLADTLWVESENLGDLGDREKGVLFAHYRLSSTASQGNEAAQLWFINADIT